jgi:hypothetical protein
MMVTTPVPTYKRRRKKSAQMEPEDRITKEGAWLIASQNISRNDIYTINLHNFYAAYSHECIV